MNFTDFLTAADAALLQPLGNAGFQRVNEGLWNFRKGDDLNVVWLQKHSSECLFCVSLGIHYAFLPKAGTEHLLAGEYLQQPDCEIKLRLTSDPAVKDQWWPIDLVSADEVAKLVNDHGLAVFDSYRLAGPIATIEAREIEAGKPSMLSPLTKVRACLFLARLHERLGNRSNCVDAATIGIKLAGIAVGPKKALKAILNAMVNQFDVAVPSHLLRTHQ
jgi:hypothetical protein